MFTIIPLPGEQAEGEVASQPLPLGTHPRLPNSLLRVFRNAQGISSREGGIFVIESDQLLQDECALSASKPVSQVRPFGLHGFLHVRLF
jgi:hypothetical protein